MVGEHSVSEGIKNFAFASKRVASKSPKLAGKFEIDGESFDVRALKNAGVAYLVHQMRSGGEDQVIAAVLDFTERALTAESAKRFRVRVLGDHENDGLDLDEIVEVFNHILGIVTAFPTGQPSDSSSSRRRTGTASRAKQPSAE